ncbi:MAG TPA: Gfo/Idh/MocA family oxidoreductase [Candidatus Dormibacteraeota bacterium]|nr:Gfo/Idh/MocA family oxidoreductase [Candidatus Dormibacteraeota bacterium]
MKGKVRWGVIASGGIAKRRTIPEGFVPAHNAHLVGVYGRNAATNKEVAKQFSAQAFDSLEGLLAADIDAVYIASPVHAHLSQVLASAKAGKHVFCEKPLGLSVNEAEQMIEACQKAKVQFGTAFMMRLHSQHQAAAKLIEKGRLGKPVYARAQLSCWYPPAAGAFRQDPKLGGGGSLIDMGNHCIDLLEMLFGPVKRVSCFTNNTIHAYESEDSAVVLLQFQNGALGTVDVFFCLQDDSVKNALELYGSTGSIIANGTIGQGSVGEMTAFLQPEGVAHEPQQNRAAGRGERIAPEPVNTYRAEIEEFSAALLEGKPLTLSGEIGLRSQKMMAACYESARTGRAVDV